MAWCEEDDGQLVAAAVGLQIFQLINLAPRYACLASTTCVSTLQILRLSAIQPNLLTVDTDSNSFP